MTRNEAISKLLTWANAQIGTTESGDNWNKYAQNMAAAYGWNVQNQPWCDVFVDAGFVECFGIENAAKMTYQPIGGFSAACRYSAAYFAAQGALVQTPEPGDQIFFRDTEGVINHTGIVVSANGGIVRTIEGNSGDAVRSNAYGIGAPIIAGYGRPNWSAVAGEDSNVPTTDVTDNNVGDKPDISNATVLSTYTVQPGDTLYGIAAKTGVPFDDIVRLNKIKNPNIIHVGEVFKLHGEPEEPEPKEPEKQTETASTDLTEVANRVIRGEFGNGVIRTILLKQQGYDPDEVQKIVNKILLGG